MAFLGTARFVRQTQGPTMLARIVADAGPAAQRTFEKKISGLALYPYDAFSGFLRSADKHLGTGDFSYCRKIGDMAARHDLETIFKVYAVKPSVENMIRGCTPIWGMYTDGCGYMEAIDVRQESTVLRITGFADMDPAHCRMMEGWMIAAMDVIGARVLPGARESMCMSDGAAHHEFACQWEPKRAASS
jgi:hypothetical protein